MTAKAWPENGETVMFCDITEPIAKAIRHVYTLRRKRVGKSIPYDGFEIGEEEQVCALPADQALSATQLEYDEEDQGRDALVVIVSLAVQLGIEQGRRIATKKLKENVKMAEMLAKYDEFFARPLEVPLPCHCHTADGVCVKHGKNTGEA